jgi:signal transduction histidine kinase
MRFRDAPIRRKLTTIILATSGVVLLLTCAAFLGYELLTFRGEAVTHLSTLGEVISTNSTAAIEFENSDDATNVLAALKAEPHVVAACLYDKAGRLFARYPAQTPASVFPAAPPPEGFEFADGFLMRSMPIVQAKRGERIGTLYLRSDMEAMRSRLRLYAAIALIVIAGSLLVAYLLSRVLQRQISGPVLALAETAKAVSARRDYSVRAPKLGRDELGLLTDTFNDMLGQIQAQNADLEKRVHERTAELEAANDELEAFCSSAAHDLRTPLRTITGFADILERHPANTLPPELRRYIGLIHDGSSQMSQLIADLLAFSRLGRQPLARTAVDLRRVFQEAFADLSAEREGRQVEFTLGALPPVFGDPALLRVTATNLLGNALKYTRPREQARIEVGITGAASEAGPVFFVRDNGVGFDMGDAGKLFGIFQRLHHAHEFEGTGVGLATVRRIIERHGGRIWAEAKPDAGAAFFFTLPGAEPNGGGN